MAFGTSFIKHQENSHQETKEHTEIKKHEFDLSKSNHSTIKTINAINIISPIISALLINPGVEAEKTDISNSFRQIITDITAISTNICQQLDVDIKNPDNFWIKNILESILSTILKDSWIVNKTIDKKTIETLITSSIELLKDISFEYPNINTSSLPESTIINLSVFKAIAPVIIEMAKFNLYRKTEEDLEAISMKLFNTSYSLAEKLSSNQQQDKLLVFSSLIEEAGKIYAACWLSESNRINDIILTYPKDHISKLLNSYKEKGGFPLDNINKNFDDYFSKLIKITEKLIFTSPKQDKISNHP